LRVEVHWNFIDLQARHRVVDFTFAFKYSYTNYAVNRSYFTFCIFFRADRSSQSDKTEEMRTRQLKILNRRLNWLHGAADREGGKAARNKKLEQSMRSVE
jgi:hypothetical protein